MAFRNTRPWTDAEDKHLRHMYREGYEPRIVAEALGRPAKTVSERRCKLMEDS